MNDNSQTQLYIFQNLLNIKIKAYTPKNKRIKSKNAHLISTTLS